MSLLTDTDIEEVMTTDEEEWKRTEEIRRTKLLISTFEPKSLTPVGYDLRVGERYLKMSGKIKEFNRLKDDDVIKISPDEIVAIETEEFIGMPQNKQYSGIIVAKVSMVEKGLSHIATSIDADYEGKMIITLSNESQRKIDLKKKDPLCTMILFGNRSPATRACGKDPNKHINFIIEEWKLVEKRKRKKVILFWIIKLLAPAVPLVYGAMYNYSVRPLSSGEAVLLAAIYPTIFIIFDKIFKTD